MPVDLIRSAANARKSSLSLTRRTFHPVYLLILVALPMVALAGCRRSSGGVPINGEADVAPEVQLILEDAGDGKPVIGPHRVTITLLDGDGTPIEDAVVSVRADMNHAGMLPVEAEAVHQGDGVYSAAFDWTMAGDWIVTATARLADGRVKSTTKEISVAAK